MNRFILYITLFLTSFKISPVYGNQYFVEVRASYFYPMDHLFREVYSGGGLYGAEIDLQMWKVFYAWAGVSYFSNSGETVPDKVPCSLTFVPINAGVKAIFYNTGVWRPYLGAGVTATYLQVKNESPYLIGNNSSWAPGGVFKTGLLINPMDLFLIDLYVDYLLQTVSMDRGGGPFVLVQDADISGFSFGGALGFQF